MIRENLTIEGLEKIKYTKVILENKLELHLLPLLDKKEYSINYYTRYGSVHTKFVDNNEKCVVPDGIAHFLEHKMFEQETGISPFKFFAKSGSYNNAGTAEEFTTYDCTGTTNFEENLKFLIQFVNQPYFTDENVEKEKGIIAEELKMYMDRPEYKLYKTIKENTFHKDEHRVDIGGSIESIYTITKEDLYKCYNNFYSPANMGILIVGNFDLEQTIKLINNETKNLKQRKLPEIIIEKEEDTVLKETEIIYDNTAVNKYCLNIKLNKKLFKSFERIETGMYLNLILKELFSNTSLFKEKIINEEIATAFHYGISRGDSHFILELEAETDNSEKLKSLIFDTLKTGIITNNDLNRMKKAYKADHFKNYESIQKIENEIFYSLLLYNEYDPNEISLINKLSFDKLNKIRSLINLDNYAEVILLKKD